MKTKIRQYLNYGLLSITLGFYNARSFAQIANPYDYRVLSHMENVRLRDSLKKYWVAPTAFKEKETQKKFRELWDDRTNFMITAINNKNFIQETELYGFISGILDQLQAGNSKLLPQKPILLIDRSGSVNAYSVGGHIICVNLGLIAFSRNREEIALIIAHELSHDILSHAENSMKERAVWLTSDEYKKSLKEVLDSKYERYSRLKKILEGYTFSRTRHNRYHEHEADSLAVVLLQNSRIAFDAKNFLRLDSADLQYQQPLKKPVKEYFVALSLPFESSWTQKGNKGLSSKNYNFKKSSPLADSLKTHPDCQERYERTKMLSTIKDFGMPVPGSILKKVNKMIIWNIFDNQNLTACLYRIFQENDKGNADEWYDFMIFNVFAGLNYSDNQLERFNAINVTSKEYISQQYYELQTMLEQLPREVLNEYHKKLSTLNFWQRLSPDTGILKDFFFTILNKEKTGKEIGIAAKSFISSHPNSMYCEFADHFLTK